MKDKRIFRRYHYKVWFPDYLGEMLREFYINLPYVDITHHAAKELLEDKRGIIPLPTKEELFHPSNILVEVYENVTNSIPTGQAQKLLIRVINLSEKYDYAYVIAREGYIVSSWAIDKTDNHRLTESLEKYYMPPKLENKIREKIKKEQEMFYRSKEEINERKNSKP